MARNRRTRKEKKPPADPVQDRPAVRRRVPTTFRLRLTTSYGRLDERPQILANKVRVTHRRAQVRVPHRLLDETAGDRPHNVGGFWRVPKRDLLGALQVLLQTGRLRIAEGLPDAQTLVDELLRVRVRIDPRTAHDSYGAWREGAHDDLVLAHAVACWRAERTPRYHPLEWGGPLKR